MPCTALYTGLFRVPAQTPLVSAYLLRQDIMLIDAPIFPIKRHSCQCQNLYLAPARPADSQHRTHMESLQAWATCMYVDRQLLLSCSWPASKVCNTEV